MYPITAILTVILADSHVLVTKMILNRDHKLNYLSIALL